MARFIITLNLMVLLLSAFGQDLDRKFISNECKGNWKYFIIEDTTYGEVLFHSGAIALCGVIATSSLTIVKTASGDSIRVLEMCNTKKKIKNHAKIKIEFAAHPSFDVNIPFDEHYSCRIYKTCYGVVTELDN